MSEEQEAENPKFEIRNSKWVKGAIVACLAVVALVAVAVQQTYARPVSDPFVRAMARVFPLPALKVDGEPVTIKEFLAEYDALGQYFKEQGGEVPTPEALETAIADTIVNKTVVRQLAKAQGVEVDAARAEKYYQDVVASQESEQAFVDELTTSFGWTVEEFKTRVVDSMVLALQMNEAVLTDAQRQAPRREAIDAAYARLQAGEDFATVARDVHSGFDGSLQTDLGYVKLSVVPVAWKPAVETLAVGSYTQVLDLPEGFAVFKVEERILAGEDTQLHLLVASVPKVTLEDVVKSYLAGVEVKRYVGEEA